jgi:hypothetical protein
MKQQIFRQGDVLIRRIKAMPVQIGKQRKSGILAEGEVTGHTHKLDNLTTAELWEHADGLYLRVGEEGVRIVHDEHASIALPRGDYEIDIQREYSPAAIRNVAD